MAPKKAITSEPRRSKGGRHLSRPPETRDSLRNAHYARKFRAMKVEFGPPWLHD
jgi:hypothetical protein